MRSHWTNRTILRWFTTPILSVAALLAACQRDDVPTGTTAPEFEEEAIPTEVQELLKVQLERFSTMPMLLTADRLGITTVQEKSINPAQQDAHNSPQKLTDVPVANHPIAHENEPTVATSPKNKKLLVAGNHFITATVRCEARHSSDGGDSWSAPVLMPHLTPASSCSDPVLAYAPDGNRVFYAYMDIKGIDFDIVVSYSEDDGATWIGPFIALNAVPGAFLYDKPWIGTPDDDADFVYVTATRFDLVGAGNCYIVFTRSTNGGTLYQAPQILDASTAGCGVGVSPVVQGSRPTGAKGGDVLAAWFHSSTDGWLNGSFHIRIRYSADYGATFGPIVNAVTDFSELPFWKGPNACYERWWPGMMPDVEIDPGGGGHLAYAHDPVPNPGGVSTTAEDGNVRHAMSPGPPYTSWSAPITVNDDGTQSAQGYIALDIKAEGTGQSAKPHATWVDHRLPLQLVSAPQCPFFPDIENLEYDIFYSTQQGQGWRPNVRVTDRASLSDFIFAGDYNDLTPTNGGLFTVFTDRRDKLSIFDLEDDIWGSLTHRVH
jgi:hypothetical protein